MPKKYLDFSYNAKNVVPIQIYLAGVPLAIFATIDYTVEYNSPYNILLWIAVSVISILICAIYVLFFKFYISQKFIDKSISLVLVLIYGAILGLIKGSSTFYLAVLAGLHEISEFEPEGTTRMITATFLGIWVAVTSPIVANFIDNYRNSIQELIIFGANVQKENYSVEKKIVEMEQKIQKEIGQDLLEIVSASKSYLGSDSQKARIAVDRIVRQIRDLNQSKIRPASHKLWLESFETHPDLNLKTLLSSTLRLNPFPRTFVILIFLASTIFGLYKEYGNIGLYVSIVNSFAVYLTFTVANFYYRQKNLTIYKFLGVIFFTVLIMHGFNNFLFLKDDFFEFVLYLPVTFVWLAYLTFAVSFALTSKLKRDQVLSEINKILDSRMIENVQLRDFQNTLSFQLSKFMHGQIQNKLISSATSLEKALQENNLIEIEKNLIDLSKEIDDNFGIISAMKTQNDLGKFLKELQVAWRGICEISYDLDPSLQNKNSDNFEKIHEAVSEAISNAVHHGKANKIQINLYRIDGENAEIEIIDNGEGLKDSEPGLGNKIYENLSAGKWSLQSIGNGQGAKLNLTFFCPINEK